MEGLVGEVADHDPVDPHVDASSIVTMRSWVSGRSGVTPWSFIAIANLALLAAASGERERAVRLFGAAHRLANLLGYRFELPERSGTRRWHC